MNNIISDISNSSVLTNTFDITKITEVLPSDVFVHHICPLINPRWLKYTDTAHYEKYSYTLIDELNGKYQSYLRYIIRNDLDYCLEQQLLHHKAVFLKKKKIRYKNTRISSLLHFIYHISNEYRANKCKTIIKTLFNDALKKYKKNTTYNNKWSN